MQKIASQSTNPSIINNNQDHYRENYLFGVYEGVIRGLFGKCLAGQKQTTNSYQLRWGKRLEVIRNVLRFFPIVGCLIICVVDKYLITSSSLKTQKLSGEEISQENSSKGPKITPLVSQHNKEKNASCNCSPSSSRLSPSSSRLSPSSSRLSPSSSRLSSGPLEIAVQKNLSKEGEKPVVTSWTLPSLPDAGSYCTNVFQRASDTISAASKAAPSFVFGV